ncbi:MAG: DNA polymerase Y family protein [Methylobacteriaceae bacterium]|nr:DNA polymerase Y family protein [Methylobacteriaceae bacterium]
MRIVAADAAALALGLGPGVALADARARAPALRVEAMNEAEDAALLRRLAAACGLYTPLVALDGADGLALDVTGCAHLFGGEAEMRARLIARMAHFGLTARAALAGAPEAARASARYGEATIVAPGAEAQALAGLPVAALDLPAATTLALTRAGLRSLGDLDARPRQALAARFGATLLDRLDRTLGRLDARLTPLRRPPELMAEKHFAEPIGRIEDVVHALTRLMADLTAALEARGRGARLVGAAFFRADGAVRRIGARAGRASRDGPGLMRLLTLELERLADPLDPGFGFDALRLAVLRSEPLAAAQDDLEATAHAGRDEAAALADLVGRLGARFGAARVTRFHAQDTHEPTRAAARRSALEDEAPAPWPGHPDGEPPLRPLTLFSAPQPIEVVAEVPDGPPLRFRWRRALHEAARAEGPERIAPEWWRVGPEAPTRDYYRVEDAQGRRFWLFREGFYAGYGERPRWFVHGLFA